MMPTKNAVRYACRLEIDINTCQEHTASLPTENLADIFKELGDMGKEIVGQGDIE